MTSHLKHPSCITDLNQISLFKYITKAPHQSSSCIIGLNQVSPSKYITKPPIRTAHLLHNTYKRLYVFAMHQLVQLQGKVRAALTSSQSRALEHDRLAQTHLISDAYWSVTAACLCKTSHISVGYNPFWSKQHASKLIPRKQPWT